MDSAAMELPSSIVPYEAEAKPAASPGRNRRTRTLSSSRLSNGSLPNHTSLDSNLPKTESSENDEGESVLPFSKNEGSYWRYSEKSLGDDSVQPFVKDDKMNSAKRSHSLENTLSASPNPGRRRNSGRSHSHDGAPNSPSTKRCSHSRRLEHQHQKAPSLISFETSQADTQSSTYENNSGMLRQTDGSSSNQRFETTSPSRRRRSGRNASSTENLPISGSMD